MFAIIPRYFKLAASCDFGSLSASPSLNICLNILNNPSSFTQLSCLISVQLYKDSSHFWPLDSEEEIRDLSTPGWGRANGGVYEVFGVMTDGVDGEIQLNHEGDTCATKTANYSCEDTGFTVSLFIKPENREDGRRQTFFKSLGKFVVYQEPYTKSLIVRVQRATEYCLMEMAMPEKIWSHLAFTYNALTPKTLTVYRNGQRIEKFIRDEGCNKEGAPEFSSSSVLLGAGDGVFAKATYFYVAIWKQVLPEERIAQIFDATKREIEKYSKLLNPYYLLFTSFLRSLLCDTDQEGFSSFLSIHNPRTLRQEKKKKSSCITVRL